MTDHDPAEDIAAALRRLRTRRGPRPGFGREGTGREGDGDPRGRGPHDRGRRGSHAHGHAHPEHGFGPHPEFAHDAPPWGRGHTRFAGPARLRVLEALAEASTPLSVGEIGERIGVDQPRASRLVQQSVALGLARREADPDDARRTRVVLTDEGAALVRGFHGSRRAAVDQALTAFTDAERAELARLLTKLADGWPG